MATARRRTYGEGCGIARALDVVGNRWALLIVRELLFGPLRFTDLQRALPRASTNMLTDRLRELDASGVIVQRRLPPPAGATVYELTDWGQDLEPVLAALGKWGLKVPRPEPAELSPASVMLFLQGAAEPGENVEGHDILVDLGGRPFSIRCNDGHCHATAGAPDEPTATLHTDPTTFYELLSGGLDLRTALADGTARVDGEPGTLAALLDAVPDSSR